MRAKFWKKPLSSRQSSHRPFCLAFGQVQSYFKYSPNLVYLSGSVAGGRDGRYHLVQLRARGPGFRSQCFWTKCLRHIRSIPDPNVATEWGQD